jgi:hypothetical protein
MITPVAPEVSTSCVASAAPVASTACVEDDDAVACSCHRRPSPAHSSPPSAILPTSAPPRLR